MGLGKWVLWIVISLLAAGILVVGVTWFIITRVSKPAGEATVIPLADQKFVLHDLPRFLVKLHDTDKARYLDLTLKLVIDGNAKDKKIEETMKKVEPFIVDKVHGYLMDRNSSEMAGQAGKEQLSHDVLEIVHKVMGDEKVTQVLVEKMIVQ